MALKNEINTEEASSRLAQWLESKFGGAQLIRVTDLVVPASAGMSNQTVLFDAEWQEGGRPVTRAMVARVQPDGLEVFRAYDSTKEARVLRPADSPMALSNPASQLLAQLLELPAPNGLSTSFIGNRS
jgi:aminoglycoside phosphotransferase (APT) family kinase protein